MMEDIRGVERPLSRTTPILAMSLPSCSVEGGSVYVNVGRCLV